MCCILQSPGTLNAHASMWRAYGSCTSLPAFLCQLRSDGSCALTWTVQLSIALRVSINGHHVSINQCIIYFCLCSSCVNLSWVFHLQGQLSRCHLCRATFYERVSVQWGEASVFLLSRLSWSDFLQCEVSFLCLFCRHTHTQQNNRLEKN